MLRLPTVCSQTLDHRISQGERRPTDEGSASGRRAVTTIWRGVRFPSGRWFGGELISPPASARAIAKWFLTPFGNPNAPLGRVELLPSPPQQFDVQGANVEGGRPVLTEIQHSFARSDDIGFFYICGHGIQLGDAHALLAADFRESPDRLFERAFDFRRFALICCLFLRARRS